MGLMYIGIVVAYFSVVAFPGLLLAVLCTRDKRLAKRPGIAALALAVCAAVLAAHWIFLVEPHLASGRMWAGGPVAFTLWGWHLPALALAMITTYIVGQKNAPVLGICLGLSAGGVLWLTYVMSGGLTATLRSQGVVFTP